MKKLVLFSIFALALNTAFATRWYVSATGTATSATSWANPASLRTALANASSGDDIWVKSGTYIPYISSANDAFMLKSGVVVYGGFAGTETALSQRNFLTNETVLDGAAGGSNSYHVVFANSVSASTRIDGFKIINGKANGTAFAANGQGGGIYCSTSSPTIANCIFTNNSSAGSNSGAAIHIEGVSTPKIQNCTFRDNNGGSGVVFSSVGNQTKIQNCTFTYNQGTNVMRGTANIDRCKFSANSVTIGVIISQGTLTLANSLIVGNTSTARILYAEANDVYQNNTITHNSNTSYSIEWVASGNQSYGNNYAYQNTNNTQSGNPGIGCGGCNSLSNQPKFVNPGASIDAPFDANDYDYRLQASSPLINVGSDNYAPATNDLDNFPRIVGSSVDCGAYEYGTVGTFFDTDMSAAVAVTPNPNTGFCTIDLQGLDRPQTLSVIDLTGKVLLTQNATATLQPLDLTALPNGQYIVSIRTETYTVIKKIVVTR